jgi:hypothetical protein
LVQSRSCCSERLTVFNLVLDHDSRTAVVAKAQQLSQFPWDLTGETKPLATQSIYTATAIVAFTMGLPVARAANPGFR